VFERHPRKKLKLSLTDIKEVSAANRTDCEDRYIAQRLKIYVCHEGNNVFCCFRRCLNEYSFICRSATYDTALRSCSLSRFTRRTHPELLEDDPNSDYLENTCLNGIFLSNWFLHQIFIHFKITLFHYCVKNILIIIRNC